MCTNGPLIQAVSVWSIQQTWRNGFLVCPQGMYPFQEYSSTLQIHRVADIDWKKIKCTETPAPEIIQIFNIDPFF